MAGQNPKVFVFFSKNFISSKVFAFFSKNFWGAEKEKCWKLRVENVILKL